MPEATKVLMDVKRKHNLEMDGDFLREAVQLLMQQWIGLEASQQIGGGHHQRTTGRQAHRNGYQQRTRETRVGEIPLRIPKLRLETYFPSLPELR